MRVVLVDNLLFETRDGQREFDLQPHLGLISLIAAVEAAGHEGVLFDPKLEVFHGHVSFDETLYRTLADALVQLEPDVIGFTSLGCNFICTAKIASYFREACGSIPILLGGPHATILDRQILDRFPQFDLILRNEAEISLPAVLQALKSKQFHSLPGITFRDGRRVISNPGWPLISNLDSLPWPAYHAYPIETLNLTGIRVEAGRGCPFSCTFCSTANFFGRNYRLKSTVRLCNELNFLHQHYGFSHFFLTHDLFTVNRKKVLNFCEQIAPKRFTWTCSARMDCVDFELLTRMQAAGCRSIYYGIEAGSPRLQKIIRKNQDLEMVHKILMTTHQLGMHCTLSFITGYPQETAEDQEQTLNLASSGLLRDERLTNVQLHLLTPEPGTQLLQDFREHLRYDGHVSDYNFPTLEGDDSEIMAATPEIFVNHHYYEAVLPRWRHIFVTHAFEQLYQLGFPVLRALLEVHEGKLGLLVSGLLSLGITQGAQPVYSNDLLHQYLLEKFGPSNVLTSVVRYVLMVNRLRATVKAMPPAAAVKIPNKFTLRPQTAVLRNLHDCSVALSFLANGGSVKHLPIRVPKRRRDYLIAVQDDDAAKVRNFALGRGTANLIQFFEQPRSRAEFLKHFASVVDDAQGAFQELQQTVLQHSHN